MATQQSAPRDEASLEELLTHPKPALIAAMQNLDGDVLVLGAGGKMGPSLAVLARRAIEAAGKANRVIAVSRFSDPSAARSLRERGVEVISADLLDRQALDSLSGCPNVVFLAGMKFGSTGAPGRTWAMNVLLPALVADRFRDSRIVALSTGNVYPFVRSDLSGATEETSPEPVGEYAWSCLGRERMFQHAAEEWGTRSVLVRLNYANDLRYGVLQDVARKVYDGQPVDVSMGWFNTVWQGDANSIVLRALEHASGPPFVLNLTGREIVSVRAVAQRFGDIFGKNARIVGEEAPTALLSDAQRCFHLFGEPEVNLETMIQWTADWIARGGRSLGKPTHFEARDGRF
jgi:Nucleoside-diphosphate-sugar epimerases